MPVKSNQPRLEKQRRLAEKLVELGYIKSYELYEDSHGIYKKEFQDGLLDEIIEYMSILSELLTAPILFDDIEDNVGGIIDNSKRKQIRAILSSDSELHYFYELNKLRSARLSFVLQLSREILHLLPEEFVFEEKEKFEILRYKYNGTDDTSRIDANRYKKVLNNTQKYELQKEITLFLEEFILRFIVK